MIVKYFDWNKEKNKILKSERNISFEEIVAAINEGHVLGIEKSQNSRYKNQYYYIVEVKKYAYVVPFIDDSEKHIIFLKTIFPSRKATRKYLHK